MLNHITIRVSDFEKSVAFFTAALTPLGYELFPVQDTEGQMAGFGIKNCNGWCDLWIRAGDASQNPHSFSCIAFTATSKQMVDEFYRQALAGGGRDNGLPGYRTEYSPGYYAAFVLDPDGHNIEAVYDDPTRKKT